MRDTKRGVKRTLLTFSVLAVTFFSSCASKNIQVPADPSILFGPGRALYAVIPVQENRAILENIGSLLSLNSLSITFMARTRIIYLASSQSSNLTSFDLIALGNFPGVASFLVFPAANGWKKVSDRNIGSWYVSSKLEGALPQSGMLFASTGSGVKDLLSAWKGNSQVVAGSVPKKAEYSARFDKLVDLAVQGLPSRTIGFFVADTAPLITQFLGSDVSLPLLSAELYLEPQLFDGKCFHIDGAETACNPVEGFSLAARLEATDIRSAHMIVVLLRVMTGITFEQQGTILTLENYSLSIETIADLAGKLDF